MPPQLARMMDGATLVNTARGALVDHDAWSPSSAGRLTAVLDVTDPEPLPPDHALLRLPTCVVTPHLAGSQGTELSARPSWPSRRSAGSAPASRPPPGGRGRPRTDRVTADGPAGAGRRKPAQPRQRRALGPGGRRVDLRVGPARKPHVHPVTTPAGTCSPGTAPRPPVAPRPLVHRQVRRRRQLLGGVRPRRLRRAAPRRPAGGGRRHGGRRTAVGPARPGDRPCTSGARSPRPLDDDAYALDWDVTLTAPPTPCSTAPRTTAPGAATGAWPSGAGGLVDTRLLLDDGRPRAGGRPRVAVVRPVGHVRGPPGRRVHPRPPGHPVTPSRSTPPPGPARATARAGPTPSTGVPGTVRRRCAAGEHAAGPLPGGGPRRHVGRRPVRRGLGVVGAHGGESPDERD